MDALDFITYLKKREIGDLQKKQQEFRKIVRKKENQQYYIYSRVYV